jgi:outer membrane protein W
MCHEITVSNIRSLDVPRGTEYIFQTLTINNKIARYFISQMLRPKKILTFTLLLWTFSIASITVDAQSAKKQNKKGHQSKTTFGIQAGKEITLVAPSFGKRSKANYNNNKSLVLKQQIIQHFKVETGLNFGSTSKVNGLDKINKLTLPVTLQYYFLPDKYKLRPYCGAGVQGKLYSSENLPSTANSDTQPDNHSNTADKKYISILFTQGVTFEVNTKIQVNQSLHFIPGNSSRVIGIDIGVGYKFP